MPNLTIQSYLKDPSIDANKRKSIADKLDSGQITEDFAANMINQKYGNKYASSTSQPQINTPQNIPQANAQPVGDPAVMQALKIQEEGRGTTLQDIGKGALEIGTGAVQQIPAAAGNTLKFGAQVANAINPVNYLAKAMKAPNPFGETVDTAGQGAQNLGNAGKDVIKSGVRAVGLNPESLPSKFGEVVTDVAGAGKIAGVFNEATNLAKYAPKIVQYFGESAPKLGKFLSGGTKAANFVKNSLIGSQAASGVSGGEIATPEQSAVGLGFDTVAGGIGKLAKKLSPFIFRSGLNPEGANFAKIDQNALDALGLNLAGSKKGIVRKADDIITSSGKRLEKILDSRPEQFTKEELVTPALDRAIELEQSGDKSGAQKLFKFINDFVETGPEVRNAKDLLNLKRFAQKTILPALKKGDTGNLTSAAKKQFWEEVYDVANKKLDDISEEVSKLNRKMEVAYSVKNPAEAALKKQPNPNLYNLVGSIPGSTPILTRAAQVIDTVGKSVSSQPTSLAVKSLIAPLFKGQKKEPPRNEKVTPQKVSSTPKLNIVDSWANPFRTLKLK